MKGNEFTAGQLKWIAAAFMLLDHTYKVFLPWILKGFDSIFGITEPAGYIILMLFFSSTTISFFLFAFLCAESCRYTRHGGKYLRNLFLFGLLSEIPYQLLLDIIYERPLEVCWGFHNVMVTLLLGALSCFGYEWLRGRMGAWQPFVPVFLCACTAYFLNTDYSAFGVLTVFICYLCFYLEQKYRLMAMGLLFFFLYGVQIPLSDYFAYGFQWYMVPVYIARLAYGCLLLFLLSKHRGAKGKGAKYFFYLFYPLHIALLVVLYLIIR